MLISLKKIYKSYIVVTLFLFAAPHALFAAEIPLEKKLLNGFSDLKKNLLDNILSKSPRQELKTSPDEDAKASAENLAALDVEPITKSGAESKLDTCSEMESSVGWGTKLDANVGVGNLSSSAAGRRAKSETEVEARESAQTSKESGNVEFRASTVTRQEAGKIPATCLKVSAAKKVEQSNSAVTLKKLKIWINLKNKIEGRRDFEKELADFKDAFCSDSYIIKKVDDMILKANHSFKHVTGIRKFLISFLRRLVYIRPNNEKLEEVSNYILSSSNLD